MNTVSRDNAGNQVSEALGAFEDEMDGALAEELGRPDDKADAADVKIDDSSARMTAHTRARMSGYEAMRQLQADTGTDLGQIASLLSKLVSAHHNSRSFVDDVHADLERANALEVSSTALSAENRRLQERLDKLEALRTRYEQLVGVMRQREASLMEESEKLRDSITELKMTVVEAGNAVMRADTRQGDLQALVNARTLEAEGNAREAQQLRERVAALTSDNDGAQRRNGELRRRVDEMTALQTADAARFAEVTERLRSADDHISTLEIGKDQLEAQLADANERAAQAMAEIATRDKRHQSEAHALKAELKAVAARLETAASERRVVESDGMGLRSQINDLDGQRIALEARCAALTEDLEAERNRTQETVASDTDSPNAEEVAEMRKEIGTLRETVDRLRRREAAHSERPRQVVRNEDLPRLLPPKPASQQNGAGQAARVAAMRPTVIAHRPAEGETRGGKV